MNFVAGFYVVIDQPSSIWLVPFSIRRRRDESILADNLELTRRFIQHPLPGMTREDSACVVTLFAPILILVRFSPLLMERQIPLILPRLSSRNGRGKFLSPPWHKIAVILDTQFCTLI